MSTQQFDFEREDVNFKAMCPECKYEFTTTSKNIKDSNLTLVNTLSCPSCGKELHRIILSEKSKKEMLEKIEQLAVKEIENELEKSLKKLK
ncbi:hypothetical protein MSBRW_0043 [Methanosarcina barkeri str. Wiesmoor]|uniref:Uncharacterized protein n=2 Tax=Methanosarcina barkeri TaxID=2208 RepID=A0A0E3LKC8_METBA|nr:hypothetical protein [Methanosarcina barkeri]AKB49296.1 hypothetical protein MSBRW_0043 [Methanosarcina barkeri str. Wiesmoor]